MSDDSKPGYNFDENLKVAVRTSAMGVWRVSSQDGLICLSHRAIDFHKIDPCDRGKRTLADFIALIHPEDRDTVRGTLAAEVLQSFRDLEYRLVEDSEPTRWLSLSGDVEKSSDGLSLDLVGSCFDITERMMMHRKLLQAQKMEAVGQLTAGISHNFNNILSAILPSLHLMAPYVKPEGLKLVRNAQLAAERATDLVAELMVVAGRKTFQTRRPIDLVVIIDRVVRICRTTFGGWVQLALNAESDLPPVLGNESQIEQVVLNLLLNARDAFEEGSISCPRVDLELDVEDNMLVLRVIDNGPGMDVGTLNRIFEPFFTTKGAGGTGLGLATAYAVVTDHGGTIQCSSSLERGTEFVLSFPVHEGRLEVVPEILPVSYVGGTERILVVDDDVLVRQVTAAALRQAGYEVVEARGGDEALIKQRNESSIDLVVLDMAMPELGGDEVLKAMRKTDPRIKVLIFTGLSDARVHQLSGVVVLQKPAGVNQLLQAVRCAIEDRQVNAARTS